MIRLSINKEISSGNSKVFSFILKILQKNVAFSDDSAIMILKVSVYRFNVNPSDIS